MYDINFGKLLTLNDYRDINTYHDVIEVIKEKGVDIKKLCNPGDYTHVSIFYVNGLIKNIVVQIDKDC
jgi:3-dehydroquinate dehydratase